jgi:hypothetical protein
MTTCYEREAREGVGVQEWRRPVSNLRGGGGEKLGEARPAQSARQAEDIMLPGAALREVARGATLFIKE